MKKMTKSEAMKASWARRKNSKLLERLVKDEGWGNSNIGKIPLRDSINAQLSEMPDHDTMSCRESLRQCEKLLQQAQLLVAKVSSQLAGI